jgi:uroporphyrinogen III methyltransferase/synthase
MTAYLVGAGPGDAGLMTARSLELIARADVILYDKLIPDGALAGARADAELVDVGKIGGAAQVPQETTNELLLRHAQAGREVVRLKGGDPFVFGRGGEEAQLLRAHGLDFEVVPGVTAGVAAPAYAGIPVTQRGVSAAVAFVTGHEASSSEVDPAKPDTLIDWPALAAFPGTLVFYMGVRSLERIATQLVAGGRPASEPVAIVQRGTFADQRTVSGTLADIAVRAAEAGVRAPAITVVGEVAALHDEIAWFGAGPLAGRSVAVTRARAQASPLAARLRALGASVVEAPAIRIEPLDATLPDLAGFDLLCITSPNGARRLLELCRDARDLRGPAIAAIGPGTADALRAGGIAADIVPPRAVAESLVAALEGRPVKRALVARAERARDLLPDALRERGAEVEILALYRTVAEPLSDDARSAALGADYVTFTSASAVRFFLEAAGADGLGPRQRMVSIGPITSAALREHGLEPHVEAGEHTPDGLVAALIAAAAEG